MRVVNRRKKTKCHKCKNFYFVYDNRSEMVCMKIEMKFRHKNEDKFRTLCEKTKKK